MTTLRRFDMLALALFACASLFPWPTAAEDIDIFVGSSAGTSQDPNVLIVLDNTSNWARQSQQWPGGLQQGQAEVRAIQTAIAAQTQTLRATASPGGSNAGNGTMGAITVGAGALAGTYTLTITAAPDSFQVTNSAGTAIGSGTVGTAFSGGGLSFTLAAGATPFAASDTFTITVAPGIEINIGLMEFVTNGNANDQGGFVRYAIRPMTGANQTALGTQLTTIFGAVNSSAEKRNSNTPYGDLMYDVRNYFAGALVSQDASNGTRSLNPPNANADSAGYSTVYSQFRSPLSSANNCARNFVIFISNPNSSGPAADSAANTAALQGLNGNTAQLSLPNFTTQTTPTTTQLGATSQCLSAAEAAACTTANISSTYAPLLASTCGDTNAYPNGCSCGAAVAGVADCASGSMRYEVLGTTTAQAATLTRTISGSVKGADSGSNADWSITTSTAAPTFVAGMTVTLSGCAVGNGGKTLNGTGYAVVSSSGTTFRISGDKGAPACTSGTATFNNAAVAGSTSSLGYTSACYASQDACLTSDYTATCASYTGGCACGGTPITTGTSCAAGTSLYTVLGNSSTTSVAPTGTYTLDTAPFNADEWARFLFQTGVPVSGGQSQTVSTYTIDVFNAQQNAQHTSLMMSMAKAGGGRYFSARSEDQIVAALKQILAEIQSVNSAFASASLPVNATNRTQNANQVFIGMFRPDPAAAPRWFGNLKQYQIGKPNGVDFDLVDMNGNAATNIQTGFLSDCAVSFWTSDSPVPDTWGNGYYWNGVTDNPAPTGKCATTSFNKFSDMPDGAFVEKGAVAEVLRKGNNPPYTDGDSSTPTWSVNRNLYTLVSLDNASGGTRAAFNATNIPSLSANALSFTQGADVNNDVNLPSAVTPAASTRTRPSIHGDVIHSRPVPINYGSTVAVYYGANDGTLRAVDSSNGKELWAFIAPEFASAAASRSPSSSTDPLTRLMNNTPLVNYSNVDAGLNPLPKDYFFDGSIGVFQNLNNTKIWLYPSMRRGGRMIYAFDVANASDTTTPPAAPAFKWRRGCPNLTNDTGCIEGFEDMGQTWSTPNVAFVKGFSRATPVVFVGGGYDACEDANSRSPSCASAKGRKVYLINGDTGALIQSFSTTRSVVADVAVVDVDNDGYVDHAYAADTGGNIYRIDLASRSGSTYTALDKDHWTMNRVAYTNGGYRKFLFAPALFPMASAGKVFVALGSGDREHPLQSHYPYSNVTNRFYVYLDNLAETTARNMDDTDLFDDYTNTSASAATISAGGGCTASHFTTNPTKLGWFMDLTQYGTGEQTVTSAVIAGGTVSFSTNRPIPPETGTCAQALGEARGYRLNLFNASGAINCTGAGCTCGGSRSGIFAGGGLPPSPVIGTVPVDGVMVTVCIGCISATSSGDDESPNGNPFTPEPVKPNIVPTRKRVYQYSSGTD